MKTPFGILKRRRAAAAAVILCRFCGTPHEKRGFLGPDAGFPGGLGQEVLRHDQQYDGPRRNLARLPAVSAVFRKYNVNFPPDGPS